MFIKILARINFFCLFYPFLYAILYPLFQNFLGGIFMSNTSSSPKANGAALIPFLLFIAVYLGTGIVLQARGVEMAFYQLPAPIAILIGIAVAFFMFSGTLDEKFDQFIKGCGDMNIMTMCIIYLLAGGFAAVAKMMGGVQATANLGLTFIPAQFITAGIFLIAAFLSLATGTSMGTIGAIGPIAIAVAEQANLNLAVVLAAVIGGAMFGDNLSMISDTTIAATRTQGCNMRDKFRVNFIIALPAAVITFILLLIFARPETAVPLGQLDFNIVKVIPYILVLVLALVGLNVFVTLATGIVSAFIVGMFTGDITLLTGANAIYDGFTGMFEIFLLSMLTGGLAYMVTANGGFEWALKKIQSFVKGKKSAEIGIATLVSVTDLATANNTVAIIISGPVAKSMSTKYKVDPRRSASLLDIWSCVLQGIIPYGAQMLVACSLAAGAVSPLDVIPNLWYNYLLALFAIISIYIPFADGVIKKNPWNWEAEAQGLEEQNA